MRTSSEQSQPLGVVMIAVGLLTRGDPERYTLGPDGGSANASGSDRTGGQLKERFTEVGRYWILVRHSPGCLDDGASQTERDRLRLSASLAFEGHARHVSNVKLSSYHIIINTAPATS